MDKVKSGWGLGRWILIILLGGTITGMLLDYSGFCFKKGKYLSDQDKIDLAINYILKAYPPITKYQGSLDINKNKDPIFYQIPSNMIYYKSVDEFKALNPDCCKASILQSVTPSIPFLSRLYGQANTAIEVKYKVRFSDSNNNEIYEMAKKTLMISYCGKFKNNQ